LGLVRGLPAPPAAVASDAGACQAPIEGSAAISWISQEQARGLVGKPDVAFVDCRAREQFEAGHVSGSLHLEPHYGAEVADPLGTCHFEALSDLDSTP